MGRRDHLSNPSRVRERESEDVGAETNQRLYCGRIELAIHRSELDLIKRNNPQLSLMPGPAIQWIGWGVGQW